MLRSVGGTVFQTAVLSMVINPETASRVTLAYARYCLPDSTSPFIKSVESVESVFVLPPSFFSNTDFTLSLQKNATQSHKLQNNQGKSMIAEDSFVPLL